VRLRVGVNWLLINRLHVLNGFDINWLNTNWFHISVEATASITTREAAFAMSVRRPLQPGISVFELVVADYRTVSQV
jgi:hypothetical protein